MEVECIGNTQIIHMEETGITQRTIGLLSAYLLSNYALSVFNKQNMTNPTIISPVKMEYG